MAKSTCSSSSSSSYSSSVQSASASSSSSSSHLGFKSVTDRRKRLAANARERKRMHLLNQAYDRLRTRLADAENKSKYDVLVQAKEYIQALAAICENMDKKEEMTQSPMNINTTNMTTSVPTLTSCPLSASITDVVATASASTNTNTYITTSITPQFAQFEPHHYPQTIARIDQTVDYV